MIRRCVRLLAAALASALVSDAAADGLEVHGSYGFDVASAYLSRGRVVEDRPILSNDLDVNLGLGPFGRIGLIHWDYSNLTGHFEDSHRRFVPETDWGVYWGYDWAIAEGVHLDTELMVYWELSHGGRPEDDPMDYEWRLKQSLKTPYVTAYWKFRRNFQPIQYAYFQVGLKRSFAVCEWLNLIPNCFVDLGNRDCLRKRFGPPPDGGSYGEGAFAGAVELMAEFPVNERFSLHALVGQFGAVNRRGRDNLHAPHRRDLTYGQIGFTLTF